MALEAEQQTYLRELPRLLEQAGKFVLVKGDKLVGVYETYDDALKAGYDGFGLQPFLVKRIQPVEQVQHFSRDISACPT